ncbi:MAG: DUF2807 domain-containing protein [Chloroflexi bacterium]|nr:DUF2807 domain-containing protein [Chloroflexota bacterium]
MTPTHTRSIFWPLALVAAGTLWLLANARVIPASNFWVLLQYWPVLLIALGLDLLLRHRWPIAGNLIAFATVALAVVAVLIAPRLGLAGAGWPGSISIPFVTGGVPGSGHVITQTRPVSNFDAVSFASFGDLTITQGDTESLTVEAEDNVLPEIRTEVQGNTLRIDYAETNGWARVRPTQPIRFTLTVKNLAELDFSGAGNIVATDLKAAQLKVKLSGAGSLKLDGLAADDVSYRLSGAGSVYASGKAARLEITLSGVGSYRGADFQSETADVTISGAGSATVWATKQLDAQISGLGSVQYYGRPAVSKNVTGLGSVEPLGAK